MTEDNRLLWAQRELSLTARNMDEAREIFLAACARHAEALQALTKLDPTMAGDSRRLDEVKCSGCGEIVLSTWRSSPTCKVIVWCSKCRPTLDSPDATRRIRESTG